MRCVLIAQTPIEAGLVRDLLDSAGIPAQVRGEALWMARGEIPVTAETAPSVWVPAHRYDEALAILRAADEAAASDQPIWTCSRCQAEVDGNLLECWQCACLRT